MQLDSTDGQGGVPGQGQILVSRETIASAHRKHCMIVDRQRVRLALNVDCSSWKTL